MVKSIKILIIIKKKFNSTKDRMFLFLILFISIIGNNINSQTSNTFTYNLSRDGMFEKVFDRFGNQYNLSDITTTSLKPIGNTTTIQAVPSISCQAGYFTLYFAPGSIFSASIAARTMLCQLATDFSNLIISNIAPGSIALYCTNTPTGSPGVLGTASPFFVFPNNPANPPNTIIDNQISKALISGQNAFANIPLSFVNAGNFYSGIVAMNPNPSNGTWNFNLNTTNINISEIDAYTIMEHEFMHALGFYSLISQNGTSVFTSTYGYYSKYDKFLFDQNGSPLIASTNSLNCTNSNLSFIASLNSIGSATTGCLTDITNCSLSAQYISPNIQVKVYTPNCYETGSSLSHFEDMCGLTATVDLGCATNTNVSLNNNLYYVMSNAIGSGICYVRRHPKNEERSVLCDLGYSVNSTYGSNLVAGSTYTYSGGNCNGPGIWGINDGLLNNNFTYVAQLTSTNAISIPTTAIANNDATTTAIIGCFNIVTAGITYSLNGSNLIITANTGFSGMGILSYIPQTSNGTYGNLTYIYVYFIPQNCPSYGVCDMIPNGHFENASQSAALCGIIGLTPANNAFAIPDCWLAYQFTPDYYKRNCNNLFDLGNNTLGSIPPINSFNGSPNDAAIGLNVNSSFSEGVMCQLTSPLQPGTNYQLSLWANNFKPGLIGHDYTPIVLNISSMNQFISGANKSLITTFTINPGSIWSFYSQTFTFTPTNSHSVLVIDIDVPNTMMLGLTNSGYAYCMLDEISLLPTPSTTFVIPNSNSCGNISYTNLAQYASPVPGYFSGTGITSTTTANGVQYNFNLSGSLSPSVYPISFNYTTSTGCIKSVWQSITIAPSKTLNLASNIPTCITAMNPVSLSATLSCQNCSNPIIYVWQPGSTYSQTYSLIPSQYSTYTCMAYDGTCSTTNTISLNLSSPNLTLSPLNSTICSGVSTTLIAIGSFASGLWSPGNNSNPYVITPNSSSTYFFTSTDINGCLSTNSIQISVQPIVNLSITLSTGSYCTDPSTLTALGNFTNLNWQPGNVSTNPILVSPNSTTIYSLTAYSTSNTCVNIQTVAVTIPTNCCSSPLLTNFTANSLTSSTTLTGPLLINTDFTVQAGTSLVLSQSEFLFNQNARIVVENNASLWIAGAHLYSCGGQMWKGILIKDGGQIFCFAQGGKSSLIEDAITAIEFTNQYTTTINPMNISNTIFNKNYIDISINNYTSTSSNYINAFQLNDCVFSCRNFTFTQTSWPDVSTSSNGLRFATTSTTSLISPYLLLNAPIVNLKAPYGHMRSYIGVSINSVGVTTGVSYPTGFHSLNLTPNISSVFTLFDAHENFVSAVNSNLIINNCVFQNTQTHSNNSIISVGSALNHSTTIVHNYKLDMEPPSGVSGNRFYDCHKAITIDNIFDFRISRNTFRSTHTNTMIISSNSQPIGQYGIWINTKQADTYSITNNEFTNLESGLIVNFYAGPVNANMNIPYNSNWAVWPQTTYINKISVLSNTFSPELSTTYSNSTNNYFRNAVIMTSPSSHYIYTACSCNSICINNNLMYRVFNGVRIDGLNTYTMSCRNSGLAKAIANNTITLDEDFQSWAQRGIEFTNSQSYPTLNGQKVQTLEGNILQVHSTVGGALTNASVTLMHLENNGAITGTGTAYPTPHILCNDLKNAYKGFAFVGWNKPASWRGNKMENLPLAMGLYSVGIIGQQGDASHPIDNEWNGSWGGYNALYVGLGSAAQSSPLFVKTGSPWTPPTYGGSAFLTNWYNATGGTLTATGVYTCGSSGYTSMNSALPNPTIYPSDEILYIAKTFAYRFLSVNDSLKNAHGTLLEFYNDLSGSSIDDFTQIELKINEADFSAVESLLGSISTVGFHQVETNYYNFYTLYLKFRKGVDPLTITDIENLKTLSDLCPGDNGSAVYQARALYQLATGSVYNGPESCDEGSSRPGPSELIQSIQHKTWDVDLFPNPANSAIKIVGKNESERLNICIKDLTGRTLLSTSLVTKEFITNLDLHLINGAYFIIVQNSENEVVVKKLLISH